MLSVLGHQLMWTRENSTHSPRILLEIRCGLILVLGFQWEFVMACFGYDFNFIQIFRNSVLLRPPINPPRLRANGFNGLGSSFTSNSINAKLLWSDPNQNKELISRIPSGCLRLPILPSNRSHTPPTSSCADQLLVLGYSLYWCLLREKRALQPNLVSSPGDGDTASHGGKREPCRNSNRRVVVVVR